MLHYALVFLVVALIAGALGVSGVAAVATNIAYVLFVVADRVVPRALAVGTPHARALSLLPALQLAGLPPALHHLHALSPVPQSAASVA